MGKRPPCRQNGVDCPERRPGCQSHCKKLAELHAYYDTVHKKRDEEQIYLTYAIPIIARNKLK